MAHTEQVQVPLAQDAPISPKHSYRPFWIAVAILTLCFVRVLFDLASHALNESLHSHILLIPFISGFLAWQMRDSLPDPRRGGLMLPIGALILAGVAVTGYFGMRAADVPISHNDSLALLVFALWILILGTAAYFLGGATFRALAFPLGFLIFLIPLPDFAVNALEIASQHSSAEVYSWFMNLSGATYYRDERTFVLPNLTIVVAQECSGIRSSFVLFIVSLVAGHMFLRSLAKKLLLAALVFPLGIARNALRIYFLSMASAHWNPDIIHSPLHHRGGPIFFALSLIPFFLLVLWLRRSDSKGATTRIS
jgi:exosortase C (VPDSG-CTERM-specific)